jgi:hypothetical protein
VAVGVSNQEIPPLFGATLPARDGVAAESTPNVETLLIADVDLDLLRRKRYEGSVQPWHDRRTELDGTSLVSWIEPAQPTIQRVSKSAFKSRYPLTTRMISKGRVSGR